MGCKLDKYTNYEVSKVTKDGNRIIVTLKDPPYSCPDGVLNNSHTFIQKDSSVSVPTLSFSTKRNAPVVLMPPGASTTQRVDPVDIPKAESHWFLITLGVLVGAFLLYKLVKWLATDTTSYTGGGVTPTAPDNFNPRPPQGGSGVKSAPTYGYHHTAAPTPQAAPVTVVNSGGGVGDLATGMILGNMMAGGGHHDTVIHERVIEHDRQPDPTPTYSDDMNDNSSYDSDSDSNNDDSSYSSDSSSDSYSSDSSSDSYSSDSGSSYDSDSGSSYGSDSSDFGSDSDGGGGWDSGGSDSGSGFGND